MDGIQSGVCDLGLFNNRVFYQRGDGMKVFSTDGTACPPSPAPATASRLGPTCSTRPLHATHGGGGRGPDGQTVEDGSSSLNLSHGLGNAVAFDGWTGTSKNPWTRLDRRYGTVHVHGHRQGESGEIVDVRRTFHVVPPAVDNLEQLTAGPCFVATAPVAVFDLGGRRLDTFDGAHWANHGPIDLDLPGGVIFAHQTGCGTRKFVVH